MTTQLESWMSPATAARKLGVSPQWVQELVDTGKLRAIRTELGRLIDPASVDELSAERQRKAGAACDK